MKKYITILGILAIFFSQVTITFALTEEEVREMIKSGTHQLSWAYYTDCIDGYDCFDAEHIQDKWRKWYISSILPNNYWTGDVYALTPIKNNKNGWGTVGRDIAAFNFDNYEIIIEDSLDTDSSDVYFDVGWNEYAEDARIHNWRKWIQGQTVPIKWYFFNLKGTSNWYIINEPSYACGVHILLFAAKDGEYDWKPVDTSGLKPIFTQENDMLYLEFTEIIKNEEEEMNKTQLICIGAKKVNLKKGVNYFKFEVEPGSHYSFIVNSNDYYHHIKSKGALFSGSGFQAESVGYPSCSNGEIAYHCNNNGADNAFPSKSAIMFYADPNDYSSNYFNYIRIETMNEVNNTWIKLVKKNDKYFSPPFNKQVRYYNAFKHKANLDGVHEDGEMTYNGHDGVDIATNDTSRQVRAVANGKVIKIEYQTCQLGRMVWIKHTLPDEDGDGHDDVYTSLYGHLENDFDINVNDEVTKGQVIGKIRNTASCSDAYKEHLHFEMWKKEYMIWNNGYSNASGGQIDPLPVLFEK